MILVEIDRLKKERNNERKKEREKVVSSEGVSE